MATKDENVIVFPNKEKGKRLPENKNPKHKKARYGKSLGWIIGVIILILISITFILPTTLLTSTGKSSIVFGKYNGKNIELAQNNYFYYQLNSLAQYYAQQNGGNVPESMYMQLYYQAFQQSAIYEALSSLAAKAKITPSTSDITNAIIESGYYNDENGSFSTELYNSAKSSEKNYVSDFQKLLVPVSRVVNDLNSSKISNAEKNAIADMSKDIRSYEYLIINQNSYPNEDAIAYANGNPAPFASVELYIASFTSKDEADSAVEAIKAGTEISSYSNSVQTDITKFELDQVFNATEADVNAILSANENDLLGPYDLNGSYAVIKVLKSAYMPSFESQDKIDVVKAYLTSEEPTILNETLKGIANEVYEEAKLDFDGAADKFDLDIAEVKNVAINPGQSQFVASSAYSDLNGYLTEALKDEDFSATLYATADNELAEPVEANSAYIIARPVESTGNNDYMADVLGNMYESYANQLSLQDVQNTFLTSDKFEDNFFQTYLEKIMGTSTK